MRDVMKRYNEVLNAAIATAEAEKGNDITSSFDIYCSQFKQLGREIETMLAAAPEPVAVLDKHLMQKLKEALRFSASHSVMSAEDERRILAATKGQEK